MFSLNHLFVLRICFKRYVLNGAFANLVLTLFLPCIPVGYMPKFLARASDSLSPKIAILGEGDIGEKLTSVQIFPIG